MVPSWQLFSFAGPNAVTNLTVAAVSTTAVQLTWVRQDDYKQGYSYQVTVRKDGKDDQPPQSTTTENYTVTGLTPGESYTWCVVTVVGKVKSTEECITDNTSMSLKLDFSLLCRQCTTRYCH